jgi:hypothetical protein
MADGSPDPGEHRAEPHPLATWTVLGIAVVLVGGLFAVRLEHQPDTSRAYASRALLPDSEPELLPAPAMNDEYLPCSDCHEGEPTNRTPRELEEEHADRRVVHGDLWCLHCHDADQRDSLHLANGQLVEFADSWQLCTQCHGQKLADWRAGVHGKRTGHWRGAKQYRTCVACHDPHAPPFQKLEPKPAPHRPDGVADSQPSSGDSRHEDS